MIDFKKVAIGKFTVSSSTVSNLQSYPFNSKQVSVVNHNSTAEVVETYVNGASWYRIYSDGWCEQGGQNNLGASVYFLKPYNHTNYTINITWLNGASAGYYSGINNYSTYFSIGGPSGAIQACWFSCGYLN